MKNELCCVAVIRMGDEIKVVDFYDDLKSLGGRCFNRHIMKTADTSLEIHRQTESNSIEVVMKDE